MNESQYNYVQLSQLFLHHNIYHFILFHATLALTIVRQKSSLSVILHECWICTGNKERERERDIKWQGQTEKSAGITP